jgi:hypothetical protein
MYDSLKAGDVVVADALFDNYFIACELRQRDIVTRVQHERVESWTKEIRPAGDILVWPRSRKPHGMTAAQYRSYPKQCSRPWRITVWATVLVAGNRGHANDDRSGPRHSSNHDKLPNCQTTVQNGSRPQTGKSPESPGGFVNFDEAAMLS